MLPIDLGGPSLDLLCAQDCVPRRRRALGPGIVINTASGRLKGKNTVDLGLCGSHRTRCTSLRALMKGAPALGSSA